MNRVNLIPQPRLARQASHRRARAWGKFLRIYCILLAIACGLTFLPAHAAGPSLDSSLSRLDRRIKSSSAQSDVLKKQIVALTKQINESNAVGNHPDWSALLAALARACAGDASGSGAVVLETLDFSITKAPDAKPKDASAAPATPPAKPAKPRENFLIKISGLAADPGGAFQFAGRLEHLDLFDRVDLKSTHAQPLGQMHAARFEIEMSVLNAPSPGAAK